MTDGTAAELTASGFNIHVLDKTGQIVAQSTDLGGWLGDGGEGALNAAVASSDIVLIATGLGTAKICREAMGVPAIAAASDADLLKAAKALRDRYSKVKIIICGRDDWQGGTANNTGKEKAFEAGIAADAAVAFPVFRPAHYRTPDETTFNDLYDAEGIGAVRVCIDRAEPALARKEREARPEYDEHFERVEVSCARLADLPELKFKSVKHAEAKTLGIGVKALERQVNRIRKEKAAAAAQKATIIEPVKQWPHPVDGGTLLDELVTLIKAYIFCPDHAAIAIAFWVLHAHSFEAATTSPFLTVTSPVMGCGKTRVLEIVQLLVPNPFSTSGPSIAAIYTALDQGHTLFIDEMDTSLGHKELRGVLNASYTKTNAFVTRTVPKKGAKHEIKKYSVWGPKCIAHIGRPPDTILDRSIVVSMQRKRTSDRVERFRAGNTAVFDTLNQKSARWAADNLDDLKKSEPEELRELSDRNMDSWRHLFAIADLAGGDWAVKARGAALAIKTSLPARRDEAHGVQLLADCKIVFDKLHKPELSAEKIIEELCQLPESDWDNWINRRPITKKAFANLLEPFGVRSKKGGQRGDRKLWHREDFEPSWASYVA